MWLWNKANHFGLDFEHGVLEWKASEIRPTSDDEHTFGDEENNDFPFWS